MFKRLYRYGRAVNSHDLLKVIATMLMIVDHIGYYVLDDLTSFRIIGRGAAPLFFFAVGFAPHHRFDWRLVIYGGILTLINIFFFNSFYLNILINFVFIKAFLEYAEIEKLGNLELFSLYLLMVLCHPAITPYLEYGTSGLMIASAARLMACGDRRGQPLLIVSLLIHFLMQAVLFELSTNIDYILSLSAIGLLTLYICYPYRFRSWNIPLGRLPILIISRYSLAIYFWHLLFLKFYLLFRIFKQAQLIH